MKVGAWFYEPYTITPEVRERMDRVTDDFTPEQLARIDANLANRGLKRRPSLRKQRLQHRGDTIIMPDTSLMEYRLRESKRQLEDESDTGCRVCQSKPTIKIAGHKVCEAHAEYVLSNI